MVKNQIIEPSKTGWCPQLSYFGMKSTFMRLFKIKYFKCLLIVILMSHFGFSSASFASANLRIGRVMINSEITYAPQYNDNIYSAHTNKESDVIHLLKPKINFNYTLKPENFISAEYLVDIARYSDDDENNYEAHLPQVFAQLKTPSGLYVSAKDIYFKTSDPYGDENEYALGIPQTKRWQNDLTLVTGYEVKKTAIVECSYNNYKKKYDRIEDQWQNRSSNAFGAALLYKVTPKTSALFQYIKTLTKYDKQNDGIFYTNRDENWSRDTSQDFSLDEFYIGTRFVPMGKLTGEVKVGYGRHTFDNDIDPEGNSYRDENGLIAATTIQYIMRERTSFLLKLDRNFTPSPDADANSYISTSCFVQIIQGIGQLFKTNLNIGLTNLDYQDEAPGLPGKEFNIFQAQVGINYQINEYVTAGISYRFKNKKSTNSIYNAEEYDRNVLGIALTAQY